MPVDERDYMKDRYPGEHPPACTCAECNKRRLRGLNRSLDQKSASTRNRVNHKPIKTKPWRHFSPFRNRLNYKPIKTKTRMDVGAFVLIGVYVGIAMTIVVALAIILLFSRA